MRKIFYLMTFMVCAIWFASCTPSPHVQTRIMSNIVRQNREKVVSYECQYCHKEHNLFYNKFVLNGHHYIVFYDNVSVRNGGIVHDPDCPCHNLVNQSFDNMNTDTQKDNDEYDFMY